MTQEEIIALGTMLVMYQSVVDVLDEKTQKKLSEEQIERFGKFIKYGDAMDAMILPEVDAIEANCEEVARNLLSAILSIVEREFPDENETK